MNTFYAFRVTSKFYTAGYLFPIRGKYATPELAIAAATQYLAKDTNVIEVIIAKAVKVVRRKPVELPVIIEDCVVEEIPNP